MELTETFSLFVDVGAAPVSLDRPFGIGTILDNDFATLSISDISVDEGNEGTTNALFDVTLIGSVDVRC